jgi:hypothetical protein
MGNAGILMVIWNILRTFGKFYDHLVHLVMIWKIFSGFGITYQQKSGNPGFKTGWPDELVEKVAQNVARPFFWSTSMHR